MACGVGCRFEYGVAAALRGSQLPLVLATVAVGAGFEESGSCSRLSSVSLSSDGGICTSGSGALGSSMAVDSTASTGAGSGIDGSASGTGASTGSSTLVGSAGL